MVCEIKREGYWIEKFKAVGAFWFHNSDPKKPHALLTSGDHSSGYFNSSLVTEDPRLLKEVCDHLLAHLKRLKPDCQITRVVGSALGAITIAHQMAAIVKCRSGFAELTLGGGMSVGRFTIGQGESVLIVEDTITTGETLVKTILAVLDTGAKVFEEVLTLVNRSGKWGFLGTRIVSLINKEMPIWEPADCPLCKLGSKAIRPKIQKNWAGLTEDYIR